MARRRSLSRADVAALLALLVLVGGSLLPAFGQIRDAANRSKSSNNLKQIILGVHNYNDANGNKLPPLMDVGAGAPRNKGLPSLFFNIAPYIEQDNVYKSFVPAKPDSYYGKEGTASHIIKTYISPADDTAMGGMTTSLKAKGPDGNEWTGNFATCSYAANGLIPWNTSGMPRAFVDGMSNTIAFGERVQNCKPAAGDPGYNLWGYGTYGPSAPAFALATPKKPEGLTSTGMAVPVLPLPDKSTKDPIKVTFGMEGAEAKDPPAGAPFQVGMVKDKPCDPRLASSPHANGMLIAMSDGSVRMLTPKISQWTFWAACTPAGNETLGADWQ